MWYLTCGDPVCHGYSGPWEGIELCTDEILGDACEPFEAQCDPVDECNALYLCADTDPTADPCPISKAEHKTEVHVLTVDELSQIEAELTALPIASWRYRWSPPGTMPRLGFIIDDVPQSHAVRPNGEQVDLYAYTTMAIATIKVQTDRIAALEQRLAALEQRLGESR